MMEMHDVVEMLLNRMKDYPEDFVSIDNLTGITYRANENKWTRAYGLATQGATEEEQLLLEAAYQAAKRAVYMGAALKTMLSDGEPEEEKMTMKTANRYSVFGQPQIMPQGSITTTSTNLTNHTQVRQDLANAYAQSVTISNSLLGS